MNGVSDTDNAVIFVSRCQFYDLQSALHLKSLSIFYPLTLNLLHLSKGPVKKIHITLFK